MKLNCTYDEHLPAMYRLGTTNLVKRPTRQSSELSKQEMEESSPILEAKIFEYRPEAVCFVGKGIWEAVYRVKTGMKALPKDFKFGWQSLRLGIQSNEDEEGVEVWGGARVFVTPSTSGLVAGYTREFKHQIFKELGDWVNARRQELGETVPLKPHPT
ncbi:uracil-DNA glycosylase-like protein [Chytridium lagenaria]|nr:uracil-DNA glycosylase-like protein [Chytridium lagenaria]